MNCFHTLTDDSSLCYYELRIRGISSELGCQITEDVVFKIDKVHVQNPQLGNSTSTTCKLPTNCYSSVIFLLNVVATPNNVYYYRFCLKKVLNYCHVHFNCFLQESTNLTLTTAVLSATNSILMLLYECSYRLTVSNIIMLLQQTRLSYGL